MIEITDKVKMSKSYLKSVTEQQAARMAKGRGTVVDIEERGGRPATVTVLWEDTGMRTQALETDLAKA